MLTKEMNELMCRVGTGTPMGAFIRRSWFPAMLSAEIPDVGAAPKAVRLLGEDLVAFRQSDGRVGVIEAACPHRGVSLTTARHEGNGLRCLYHGWLVDADGSVLEMPAEPYEDVFRKRVRSTSYATHEEGGVLWVYMGDQQAQPPFPQFEWTGLPQENVLLKKVKVRANWVQVMEGTVDSSHAPTLHQDATVEAADENDVAAGRATDATKSVRPTKDRRPRIKVKETDYGFHYAALYRAAEVGLTYARVTEYVAPFYTMVPAPSQTGVSSYHLAISFVPIDDENTWMYFFDYSLSSAIPDDVRREIMHHHGLDTGIDENYETTGIAYFDGWGQDREAMARGESFTGIRGVILQDVLVAEAQGRIQDRTIEHIGAQDQAISMLRNILIKHAEEAATGARSSRDPELIRYQDVRPGVGLLQDGEDWQDLGHRGESFQPARTESVS